MSNTTARPLQGALTASQVASLPDFGGTPGGSAEFIILQSGSLYTTTFDSLSFDIHDLTELAASPAEGDEIATADADAVAPYQMKRVTWLNVFANMLRTAAARLTASISGTGYFFGLGYLGRNELSSDDGTNEAFYQQTTSRHLLRTTEDGEQISEIDVQGSTLGAGSALIAVYDEDVNATATLEITKEGHATTGGQAANHSYLGFSATEIDDLDFPEAGRALYINADCDSEDVLIYSFAAPALSGQHWIFVNNGITAGTLTFVHDDSISGLNILCSGQQNITLNWHDAALVWHDADAGVIRVAPMSPVDLTGYVTLDTAQTITGAKTFTAALRANAAAATAFFQSYWTGDMSNPTLELRNDANVAGEMVIRLYTGTSKAWLGGLAGLRFSSDLGFGIVNSTNAYGGVNSVQLGLAAAGVWDVTNEGAAAGTTFGFKAYTPAQITATENNYAGIHGRSLQVRLSSNAVRTINGITAGVDGEMHILTNAGIYQLTFAYESGSATGARITNESLLDFVLSPQQSALVWYDATSTKWRIAELSTNADLGAYQGVTFGSPGMISHLGRQFVWPVSLSEPTDITGVFGTAQAREYHLLVNEDDEFEMTVLHDSGAGGTPILCSGEADVVIPIGGSALIWYDPTVSKWRLVATAGGFVDLTSAQTITGQKTFEAELIAGGGVAAQGTEALLFRAAPAGVDRIFLIDNAGFRPYGAGALLWVAGDFSQGYQQEQWWHSNADASGNGDIGTRRAAAGVLGLTRGWTTVVGNIGGTFGAVAYTPAQITATENNYAGIHGRSLQVRLSSDAARTINGITAGVDGEMHVLRNVGSFAITLSHQSGSATGATIYCDTLGDIVLQPGARCDLEYDATSGYWLASKRVNAFFKAGSGLTLRFEAGDGGSYFDMLLAYGGATLNANGSGPMLTHSNIRLGNWPLNGSDGIYAAADLAFARAAAGVWGIGNGDGLTTGGTFGAVAYTPAQITADQNNYAGIHGRSLQIRLSSDAVRTINGITAGVDGELHLVRNVGSFALRISHESGSATGAQIYLGALSGEVPSDLMFNPGDVAIVEYDATSSRWLWQQLTSWITDYHGVYGQFHQWRYNGSVVAAMHNTGLYFGGLGRPAITSAGGIALYDTLVFSAGSTGKIGFASGVDGGGTMDTYDVRAGAGVKGLSGASGVGGTFGAVAYTPAQITGTENNYAGIHGRSLQVRLSSDAARTVNGITAGVDGETHLVRNVGIYDIAFTHNSGSATGAPIYCDTQQTTVLQAQASGILQYESASGYWRFAKLPNSVIESSGSAADMLTIEDLWNGTTIKVRTEAGYHRWNTDASLFSFTSQYGTAAGIACDGYSGEVTTSTGGQNVTGFKHTHGMHFYNGSFSAAAYTPAQITSTQNNFASIHGRSLQIRLSGDAARTINGITAGVNDGETHIVRNVGSFNLIFSHLSGSATGAQIYCDTLSATFLEPGARGLLEYDATSGVWVLSKFDNRRYHAYTPNGGWQWYDDTGSYGAVLYNAYGGTSFQLQNGPILTHANLYLYSGAKINGGPVGLAYDTAFNRVAAGVWGIGNGDDHDPGGALSFLPLSPAQITSNQTNYSAFVGASKIVRISTDAANRRLQGAAAGTDGVEHVLTNTGSYDIIIEHNSASATGQVFLCSGSRDIILRPNGMVDGWYDATTQAWRMREPADRTAFDLLLLGSEQVFSG